MSMLEKFIECYKNNPVLWDTTNKAYRNETKRKKAIQDLVKIMRGIKKSATAADVEKKIKTLRATYSREVKIIKRAAKTGRIYQSIWWYDLMEFLKDHIDDSYENKQLLRRDNENYMKTATTQSSEALDTISSNSTIVHGNVCHHTIVDAVEPSYSTADNFQSLTGTWTNKLKNISSTQFLLAEKAINNIIFEAEMGTLSRNSVKIIPTSLSSSIIADTPIEQFSEVYVEVTGQQEYKFT